ncbi:Alpha/Beta hydrolase protein [Leptodontidium sp. MPI-SDFR-AT-0119]|nr:Alpha/Beta hydrolase protein [Leptodontidium sp. MPI-SDFR-AT-0119]
MRLTRCHRLASTSVKTQWIGANLGSLALDDGTTNRNWGFSDQVAALDWVRANIQDFGGDLDRITITGQSFGAIYVTSMLGSPKAAGKFSGLLHRAIRLVRFSVFRMPGAMIFQLNGDKKAQLECLRALPVKEPANLAAQVNVLTKDGTYLTTDRLTLDGSAPIAKVPVLMGMLRDDGAPFTPYPISGDLRTNLINGGFAAQADAIISSGKFPLPSGPDTFLNIFNVTSRAY